MGLPGLWLALAGAQVTVTDCHPGEAPHIRKGFQESLHVPSTLANGFSAI